MCSSSAAGAFLLALALRHTLRRALTLLVLLVLRVLGWRMAWRMAYAMSCALLCLRAPSPRVLSANMNKLPGKKLGSVVQIIHEYVALPCPFCVHSDAHAVMSVWWACCTHWHAWSRCVGDSRGARASTLPLASSPVDVCMLAAATTRSCSLIEMIRTR